MRNFFDIQAIVSNRNILLLKFDGASELPWNAYTHLKGVMHMGRGRAKAKQTKVARQLKYNSPEMDLDSLQRELAAQKPHNDWDDEDEVDYEDKYADYIDEYDDEDDVEDDTDSSDKR